MDKKFIEQSKHIRREYFKIVKDVSNCENKINKYKSQLNKIQDDLSEELNDEIVKNRLILIEKNIKAIEDIMQPHIKKISQLEKDADKLFENIKERYPNITEEDIQKELIPHLSKIKYKNDRDN